jgi:hypothetical protein
VTFRFSICVLAAIAATAVLPASPAAARSSIRVAVSDQSPRMFDSPDFQRLQIRRTRYFVASDVMQDSDERSRATAFVEAARSAGVSTLLHISTTDLRANRGRVVAPGTYRRNAGPIVSYFRKLGVREFGAWNEVNHKTQETWNHVGNAVSYFKSMYSAVRQRCRSCAVLGLDVLDQAGVERYMRSFYARLSPTWRKRLKVVGIHNYADVNRNRSTGTRTIINTARRYNRSTKFWFTETGALASFRGSFPYGETRQAARMRNMFALASRFKGRGVQRVYEYNWFGVENGGCGRSCLFDAGLVDPDGAPRPVYNVFASKLRTYSRYAASPSEGTSGGASTSGSSSARPEISRTRSIWRGPRTIDRAKPASSARALVCASARRPVESMNVSSRRSSTSSAPGSAVASAIACSNSGALAMSSSPDGASRVVRSLRTTFRSKDGIGMSSRESTADRISTALVGGGRRSRLRGASSTASASR